MDKITIKSDSEVKIMQEGGKRLGEVRNILEKAIKVGVSAAEIENLAVQEIEKRGGKPSFKMVPGYSWATCINVNDGVVHGIPSKKLVFASGDIVSVDVGMFYKGFHTDTSTSKYLSDNKNKQKFLESGRAALNSGIKAAKPGNKIKDIAGNIERSLTKHNLRPIKALTGHGIGKSLHEAPYVPCFVGGMEDDEVELKENMTLAIEIMYTEGKGAIVLDKDGWTIRTKDGKISALFEETVVLTKKGPLVIT